MIIETTQFELLFYGQNRGLAKIGPSSSLDYVVVYRHGVEGQEHSPIRSRAQRGFSVLRDQVLVLFSGQELGPFAEYGQEHGTIADLKTIKIHNHVLILSEYQYSLFNERIIINK